MRRVLRHGPAFQLEAGGAAAAARAPADNRTGLPDRLKAGVEALSGVSLDGVRVHYNSSKPAQLNALAYAQGSDIHLGPGQEQHLPHEAWHVVQQAQGRVRPTMQMKDGVAVNDDRGLEREADLMGSRAEEPQNVAQDERLASFGPAGPGPGTGPGGGRDQVVQRLVPINLPDETKVFIIRSTSGEFHNQRATIVRRGDRANEYLVAVDGTEVFARADQLAMAPSSTNPLQVDFRAVEGKSNGQILSMINDKVRAAIGPNRKFVVGGSFAAFLHVVREGQSARIPRDLDIIVERSHWPFSSTQPQRVNNIDLCGIPLEFHRSGDLVGPTPEEKASGFIGPNVLLAAAIIKLRDKHGLFGAALTGTPTPARAAGSDEPSISAKEFLEEMTAVNHRMMMMSDQEISDDSKKVWMKTMTDIEALARIGAVAPRAERRPDSSGWDSD